MIIFNAKEESKLGNGTRQAGKTTRKYLMNIMNTNKNRIVLDFKDVDMVSSLFPDEAIAQLIMEIGKDALNNRSLI